MPPKERKIAIMGFRSVGKSSLTIQFVEGMFVDSYDPTIEDTFVREFTSTRGQTYKLHLIDTAGQDEYSLFPQNYAMNINGYVLVFSVNSKKSFDIVQVIHDKILDQTGKLEVPCVVVGNKADLRMERVVTVEQGKALAEKWGAKYIDASAKENQIMNVCLQAAILMKGLSQLGKLLQRSRFAACHSWIRSCNLCSSSLREHSTEHPAHNFVEISVSDSIKSSFRGPCITSGWITTARHQSKHSFINIVDGLSPQHLQVVLPAEYRKDVSQLCYGASVKVTGTLIDSPAKGQDVELQAGKMVVLGANDKNNYPFSVNTRSYSSEYARQYLHLRPKLPEFAAMLRLRSACKKAIHDYFHDKNYVQIDTPILTTNDCEGAGETFTVCSSKSHQKNMSYFGSSNNVNLTVSGQLHLEVCNSGLSKVYTFGPIFRADNAVDRTHLSEFYMLEGEVAFITEIEDLLKCVEDFTKTVAGIILENKQADIHSLRQGSTGYEDRDVSKYLSKPFHRLTYTDAVKLLRSTSYQFKRQPMYGQDLHREHEHYILEAHDNIPVFVTDWPKNLKPFYMHLNDDQETVACMDLIVPGPGELFGGSVRESRYEILKEVLDSNNMAEENNWYLDIRQFGSVPHAGFGMGFERFLQFLFGVKQIRDTIPFPRYSGNCKL